MRANSHRPNARRLRSMGAASAHTPQKPSGQIPCQQNIPCCSTDIHTSTVLPTLLMKPLKPYCTLVQHHCLQVQPVPSDAADTSRGSINLPMQDLPPDIRFASTFSFCFPMPVLLCTPTLASRWSKLHDCSINAWLQS